MIGSHVVAPAGFEIEGFFVPLDGFSCLMIPISAGALMEGRGEEHV
jgi:hypothetical protein